MNKQYTKAILSAISAISIAGCNGGGGDSSASNPPAQGQIDAPAAQSYSLKGVAAVGSALQNGTVKIVDANGKQYSASIDPVSGVFQINNLQASVPLLLQAVGMAGGQTVTLHSAVVDTPNSSQVTVNVNPITDMALLAAAVQSGLAVKSPAEMFTLQQQKSGTLHQILTNTNIQNALSTVQEQSLSDEFRELRNKYAAYESPFYGNFAIGAGLDKVLDRIQLKLDAGTGAITEIIHTSIDGTALATPKQRSIALAKLPRLSFLSQAGVYTGGKQYFDYTVVVGATGQVDYFVTGNSLFNNLLPGYIEAGSFQMSKDLASNALIASQGSAFVANNQLFKSIIDPLGGGNDATIVNGGPKQGDATLALNSFSASNITFTLADSNAGSIGRPLDLVKQTAATPTQLSDLYGSYADEKAFDPLVNPRPSSNCLRITPDSVIIDGHPAELTKDIGTQNAFTLNAYFPATGTNAGSSIRAKVIRNVDGSLQIVGTAPRAKRTGVATDRAGLAFSLKLNRVADRSCN